ncbi:hypothetical protein B0J13DRAFT_519351 [Dactylonectria estremocensis]|uniref:Uncharacterized protein n=1 Tax=Dactylonectria estremocensis TaxID=1079267 RepID=A0A9P9FDP6_9HYPO|nr:hypothetical protein B0J13DRAFT_519351 [Dactylonectria estremocensis]
MTGGRDRVLSVAGLRPSVLWTSAGLAEEGVGPSACHGRSLPGYHPFGASLPTLRTFPLDSEVQAGWWVRKRAVPRTKPWPMILDSRRAAGCGRSGSALVLGPEPRSQTVPRLGPSLGPHLAAPGCLTPIGFQLMLRLAALELVVGRRTAWRRVHMQQGLKNDQGGVKQVRTRFRESNDQHQSQLQCSAAPLNTEERRRWPATTNRRYIAGEKPLGNDSAHSTMHEWQSRTSAAAKGLGSQPLSTIPCPVLTPPGPITRQQGGNREREAHTHALPRHMLGRGMHWTQACLVTVQVSSTGPGIVQCVKPQTLPHER